MASRKSFLSRASSIFPSEESETTHFNPKASDGGELELDEADVWNFANTVMITEAKKGTPMLKRASASSRVSPSSSSLPMNIPDWSKNLKDDNRKSRVINNSDDDDDDFGDECEYNGVDRLPPHEYLARTRGASLSVHEGKGRTLKGRDLRSVRNAIWKKVGFED